jgi:hypothetical protein
MLHTVRLRAGNELTYTGWTQAYLASIFLTESPSPWANGHCSCGHPG